MDVIFYGAGSYLARNLKRLRNLGYNPLCVCDADKTKHNRPFHGNPDLLVLPLDTALKQYAGSKLYITVDNNIVGNILHYLTVTKNIAQTQIINYTPIEYRLGCSDLETTIKFRTKRIFVRCYWRRPGIDRTGDTATDIRNFDAWRNHTLKAIKSGETTPCEGCEHLKYGWYPIKQNLTSLQLSDSNEHSYCNFNCIYCFVNAKNRKTNELSSEKDEQLDVLRYVSENIHDQTLELQFSTGELTVHPNREEIFQHFTKYETTLFTNAAVYNHKIVELMEQGMLTIVVSMDCGTRETFAKIKRVDCYEQVCENLVRYAQTGGCIILKYIMLTGINDNPIDIDGFVSLAIQLGAVVQISNDTRTKLSPMPEQTLNAALSLVRQVRENNLLIIHEKDVFSENDNKAISGVIQDGK